MKDASYRFRFIKVCNNTYSMTSRRRSSFRKLGIQEGTSGSRMSNGSQEGGEGWGHF